MWFTQKPTAAQTELDRLYQLVDTQSRLIHQLETVLARLTSQPPPAPWHPHSRPPLPLSTGTEPRKIRGAESVSIMDREARREEEQKGAVQEAFKLPAYMEKNTREALTAIPPEQVPPGHAIGGGFSPPQNAPPPDKSPTPGSPSTGS